MKSIIKIFTISVFLLGLISQAQAAAPVLFFSDIIHGPNTGLNDGLGEGAIVTVWGNNLGSTQGASEIYFKDFSGQNRIPAHIYYWKNADGISPGGPANLYESHGMQEIAFSIPASSVDGVGLIHVNIDGVESNGLPFTVQPGNIYWVSDSGDNNNDGTFANPWHSIGHDGGATDKIEFNAGDIVYTKDYHATSMQRMYQKQGSLTSMLMIVAYPGQTTTITSNDTGINAYQVDPEPEWFVFSKFYIEASWGTGIEPLAGRVVGNYITDGPNGSGCADGSSGAISSGAKHWESKIYGNNIYEWGCSSTSNQEHTTYMSMRNHGQDEAPFEMSWNYLKNNQARFGIHIYDEHDCWAYTDTVKIHDNVIKDQSGFGIDIDFSSCDIGREATNDWEIYNNLLIRVGNNLNSNGADFYSAILIRGSALTGHAKIYNNTIYGWGWEGTTGVDLAIQAATNYSNADLNFAGTWEMHNNIIYDLYNQEWDNNYQKTPLSSGHNIWYNGGDNNPSVPPSWDSSPLIGNPQFISTTDFHLQPTSPARNAGATMGITLTDLECISRPQGSAWDIGAYEYAENQTIRADVDQNSSINSTDALLTLRNSLGLDMSGTNWQVSSTTGDVNCDSSSNSADAMLILRQSLGLDMSGTGWCE